MLVVPVEGNLLPLLVGECPVELFYKRLGRRLVAGLFRSREHAGQTGQDCGGAGGLKEVAAVELQVAAVAIGAGFFAAGPEKDSSQKRVV
jgi:hypothetical protein